MRSWTEAVAGAADGVNQFGFEAIIDFAAQPSHEYFEHIGKWIVIFIPYALGDFGARYHATFLFGEELQQVPLFRRQRPRRPASRHLACTHVDLEIGDDLPFFLARRLAAGKCPDTGEQLAKGE